MTRNLLTCIITHAYLYKEPMGSLESFQ